MKILALTLSLLALIACNKKDDKDDDDGDLVTVSELLPFVGNWAKCHVVTGKGTNWGGSASYRIQLVISASGTFTHSRWYYSDSSTCTGTENPVSWSESGNVDYVRDSSSVSGAKEISFERTSSYVTARDYTAPKNFLTVFKLAYNPFSPPSMTVTNPTAIFLNNQGSALMMGDMFVNSGITYNTLSVSGSTMSMHEPIDYHPGQISAPSSQGYNLTKY